MKVLLFIDYGPSYPTEEMQKIMDKYEFPYNRIGEIVEYIENNSELVVDISASSLLKTKHHIGKLYCSLGDVYGCCAETNKPSWFASVNPISSIQIADVDTTRPWCIDNYDGKEYIKYLDYNVVNEDINYCKWKDE